MKPRKLLLLTFISILAPSCVTVPETVSCTVPDYIANGMICATSYSGQTSDLSFDQTIQFLEPQINPPRAGAVCRSFDDETKIKTALEQACRELGSHCTPATRQAIQTFQSAGLKVKLKP